MIGPFGVPVEEAEVYSSMDLLGMSAADGTLTKVMCAAENMTAVKEDLIHETTEYPGGNTVVIVMRVTY